MLSCRVLGTSLASGNGFRITWCILPAQQKPNSQTFRSPSQGFNKTSQRRAESAFPNTLKTTSRVLVRAKCLLRMLINQEKKDM